MHLRSKVCRAFALCFMPSSCLPACFQELAQLSTQFSNNVLDATKRYTRLVTDAADVAGLTPTALALAAQTAVSTVRPVPAK